MIYICHSQTTLWPETDTEGYTCILESGLVSFPDHTELELTLNETQIGRLYMYTRVRFSLIPRTHCGLKLILNSEY